MLSCDVMIIDKHNVYMLYIDCVFMLSIYMFECRCACDDLLVMMNINSDCANGRVEPDAVDAGEMGGARCTARVLRFRNLNFRRRFVGV